MMHAWARLHGLVPTGRPDRPRTRCDGRCSSTIDIVVPRTCLREAGLPMSGGALRACAMSYHHPWCTTGATPQMKLLAVLVHELSHASACIMTCGKVDGLQVRCALGTAATCARGDGGQLGVKRPRLGVDITLLPCHTPTYAREAPARAQLVQSFAVGSG